MTETTDPESYVKRFAYDAKDNVTSVTDGRGGLTAFTYDTLDRMVTRTNPVGEVMAGAYDTRDNLATLTREDGTVETASYDGLSRRTRVVTPDNTLAYAYDPGGNLTEAADGDSRVTFTYDNRNRLATTTTDGTVGPQPQVTLSYSYDELDRRLTMSDSLGGTTSYDWDVEDRLSTLTAPWGTVYSFGYDGEGRRVSLTSTSGRASSWGYTNGLLTALSHAQSGVTLTDLTYAYDPDGQLTAIVDTLDPAKSKAISNDALNRLVQVAEGVPVAQGGVPVPVEDYAYDGEGNRTASHLSGIHESNGHNQLLEDDSYRYAYDLKGNRVSRTTKADGAVESYAYDSQNRLVGYTSPATTASYAYDALDRRVAKTVDGAETAYVYDISPEDPLANDDIVMEYSDGILTRRWMHSDAVDEPVGFEEYTASSGVGAGTEHALYADRQGSVIWVTEPATGQVVAGYEYDGYGRLTQTSGTLSQPYGYTGREYDTESGLYHYRARAYDPAAGVFVQTDPIEFAGGQLAQCGEVKPYRPAQLKGRLDLKCYYGE
ncbi:RHS repeat-associated core domain-containing protein [Defluviimonas salinarum]|uniref:RHS repeat-associated core domain-containing protein n=1 Tax=Defluviimonas salinarum TaxID=2992147 RepID=UPI003D80A9F7